MIVDSKQDITNNGEIDLVTDTDNAFEPEPVGLGETASSENGAASLPSACDADAPEAVLESLSEMKTTLASHTRMLAELGQRDALFQQLHERLAAYEQDERSRNFLEPLARKAAPIHRRLKEQASEARNALESLPQALQQMSPYYWAYRSLEATRAELETLLADFGIETFVGNGNVFDRRRQEAVERVTALGSNRVGGIVRRIAPGFRIGERIVVAERVAVYVTQVGR